MNASQCGTDRRDMRSQSFMLAAFALLLGHQTLAQWVFKPPKKEGEECGTLNGEVWTCQRNCHKLQALASSGRRITCYNTGDVISVCCPPLPGYISSLRITDSISNRKCLEYQSACGSNHVGLSLYGASATKPWSPFPGAVMEDDSLNRTKRDESEDDDEDKDIFEEDTGTEDPAPNPDLGIYNGNKSAPGEFPHSALVGFGEERNIKWKCGGTLISERYVLSAAHCSNVTTSSSKTQLAQWVRLGDLDYNTDTDDARPQQFRIVDRIVHPGYKSDCYYNDIVLFRLDRDAEFTHYVAPACLYTGMNDPPGFAIATGWGKTERHLGTSTRLMKVDLDFVPIDECQNRLSSINGLEKHLGSGIDRKSMICAWKENKDTCKGDSGGPLVLGDQGDSCLARLVGITSFGADQCESNIYPAVYVRVAHFVPWIESHVWPSSN